MSLPEEVNTPTIGSAEIEDGQLQSNEEVTDESIEESTEEDGEVE
ncbi:hypothetical protein [Emticicia sp. TH156]|nr:hypothetical protein [Emticicia sp. TH156]